MRISEEQWRLAYFLGDRCQVLPHCCLCQVQSNRSATTMEDRCFWSLDCYSSWSFHGEMSPGGGRPRFFPKTCYHCKRRCCSRPNLPECRTNLGYLHTRTSSFCRSLWASIKSQCSVWRLNVTFAPLNMAWNEHDSTPSTSGSSVRSATPFNSWPSLQSEATKEVLQSVLSARKMRKTSLGGETIWPLDLEAALLEALEIYQPDDSLETRMLGRFPRRNRFISDYIFDKSGKRRSPKQVGSRLQQLRESCGGTQLQHLLSPFRKPSRSESAESALDSPILPLEDRLFPNTTSSRHTIIYIDILADEPHMANRSSPWLDAEDVAVIHASDHPRRLESIDPTVSFTAPSAVVAHSRFTSYSEDLVLHTETVPLMLSLDQAPQSRFLYSTPLAPKSWSMIVHSPDPTRFIISQEVVNNENILTLFSATYKFSYKQHSTTFPWPHPGPSRDIVPYNTPGPLVEPCENALI
ncbi:hypothetical protein B0H12DRAFT_523141 [Mycena haematopus]|nr:hypothetical protein B0H12DRAFT_523141 [Mycena haematopus]